MSNELRTGVWGLIGAARPVETANLPQPGHEDSASPTEQYVAQLNIERFRKLLTEEADRVRRQVLVHLLGIEVLKLDALINLAKTGLDATSHPSPEVSSDPSGAASLLLDVISGK